MTPRDVMLVLLTIFWTLAYIFAVVYAARNKTHAIPPFSVSLNFSWEIIALFYYWEYVDIAWVIVDIFIVALMVQEFVDTKNKKALLYLIPFVCYGIICAALFNKSLSDGSTGYIFLSFFMDLIMAVDFHLEFRQKQQSSKINSSLWFVALFKLLGDATALIIYRMFPYVVFLGLSVLAFNIVYIVRVSRYLLNWKNKDSTKNIPTSKKKNKKKPKKKKKDNKKQL